MIIAALPLRLSPRQMRVVEEAAGAPNLASTLNQGGFNIGCANGAWLGSIPISHGLPYNQISWVGCGVAIAGLVRSAASYGFDLRKALHQLRSSHERSPILDCRRRKSRFRWPP